MSDPMLDGITRWDVEKGSPVWVAVKGEFVRVSDLPALIAAVREDEREKAYESGADDERTYGTPVATHAAYEQGQRDERERIRAGVDSQCMGHWSGDLCTCAVSLAQVLAVIDGGES